jgi:hypothetical protein
VRRLGPSLSFEQSIRVLLDGVCGANLSMIAKETKLSNGTIRLFMGGKSSYHPDTLDLISEFVWKKLNAHLLICDEDKL